MRKSDIFAFVGGEALVQNYPTMSAAISSNSSHLHSIRTNAPRNYWKNRDNQKAFVESLATKLQLSVPSQLDKISHKDVISNGGRQLLRQYSSWFELCQTLYPEGNWNLSAFSKTPRNAWDDPNNQRKFFDELISRLGFESPLGLGELSVTTVREAGGRSILDKYSSYSELLQTLYPKEDWKSIEKRKPRGYWNNLENVKEFTEMLADKFAISNKQDWYRISFNQVIDSGGDAVLRSYGNLCNILKAVYPEETWNARKFRARDKRSAQRWLFIQVSKLFPDVEVIEEYSHKEIARTSGQSVELDIYIPKLRLAFEYHGIHHYKDTAVFGPIELYAERDMEKESICKTLEITLVVVPYSWDNELESLKTLIPKRFQENFTNVT